MHDREATAVDNKGFQIPPLSLYARIGKIYTIRFKNGLIRRF